MDKGKHGGKRSNAGRKKAEDPKKAVTIYIRESIIQHFGGQRGIKEKLRTIIEPQYNE